MCFDVGRREYLDGGPLGAGQVTACLQVVGQASAFVAGPCLKGQHELALVDHPRLKREQSEKEMSVSDGGHDMSPIVGGRFGESSGIGGRPGS